MIGPFVLMPMCDCVIDKATQKKKCTPFLRAFVLGCDGLQVKGDYDYNAKHYEAKGEISSEAKCCDCADCGCGKSKACYDIKCLLRSEELNGGLTNLQIVGPDGIKGAVVTFDPPANDVKDVWTKLNSIKYLGYDSWGSSGPGLLCVEFAKGASPPGEMTACRFRRFTMASNPQSNWLPVAWYTRGNIDGYKYDADSYAIFDPSATSQTLATSYIHYLCNVSCVDLSNGPFVLAPAGWSQTRVFRTTFNADSTHDYVLLGQTSSATDVLGGVNITAGYMSVFGAFPAWLEAIFTLQGIASHVALSQTLAPQVSNNFGVARFNVNVDLPCRYVLKSMNNVMVTNALEVDANGVLVGAGATSNHLYNFVQTPGVGGFAATPSIDGVGGGTNLDGACAEIVADPGHLDGDLSTLRTMDAHPV